jgi:hypothetical protein
VKQTPRFHMSHAKHACLSGGLKNIVRSAFNVRNDDCDGLTDASVVALVERCPHLSYCGVVMSGEDAPRPYLENLIVLEIKTNKQTNKQLTNVDDDEWVEIGSTASGRYHDSVHATRFS